MAAERLALLVGGEARHFSSGWEWKYCLGYSLLSPLGFSNPRAPRSSLVSSTPPHPTAQYPSSPHHPVLLQPRHHPLALHRSSLDENGQRRDRHERPELSQGCVEFVAPVEYSTRPPVPPIYVFVIDVSAQAVQSGMLATVCRTVRACLDRIPGDEATRVGFITFDRTLHFYNLHSATGQPHMLVVPELDDPFVPLPDDLLANLRECRGQVEALLDSLPGSFASTDAGDSATGPALQAAFLSMSTWGGKLMLFQAATPSLGVGRVKNRDNPTLYGTDREHTMRNPEDPFWKKFASDCVAAQITVDVFAFGKVYMDLASLATLPKHTAGNLCYFPGYSASLQAPKLEAELTRNLTRETAWEAVMRLR